METTKSETYRVKYFDPARSRAGKPSVLVRTFTDRDAAVEFASRNRVHARPCTVETIGVES